MSDSNEGDKEESGAKTVMAMATRVAGKEEGDGNGSKSNGDSSKDGGHKGIVGGGNLGNVNGNEGGGQ